MGSDFIGDVHGHAERLETLLQTLGYRQRGGAWRHPERTAIFVGDFIDRGPGQLRTLRLVRDMIDAGAARAVMGNHELNAIGWATPDGHTGQYLRPRHGRVGEKNALQHAAFLSEVGADSAEHLGWTRWFLEMPLWIETASFRVIHACWDPAQVAVARPYLRDGERLRSEDIVLAHQPGHPLWDALEVLLKGPEAELPAGYSFSDKEGHVRTAIRTRWWSPGCATYRDAYIGPPANIPDLRLDAPVIQVPDRPTFIGHYWLPFDSAPAPLSQRVASVDYSVAKGGPMVAYRYDGEAELSADKFVAA